MRVTNRHELPEPYWRACAVQRPHLRDRISVTELLQPPQMRTLRVRHDRELEEDCADRAWTFFGTAVHAYLAGFAESSAEAEVLREFRDGETGLVVHGTPDYFLGADGWLTDWKTTTVGALTYAREEWAAQLNLYRWLLAMDGKNVVGLQVWALLRDFEANKRGSVDGYPSAPLVRIPVDMWPAAETADYLARRLRLHQVAQEQGIYTPCTDEERWKRDTWAVVPRVGERAVRGGVWPTKDQAREARTALGLEGHEVERRHGEPVRCQAYCVVRSVCPQWAAEQPPTLLGQLEESVRRLEARA